MIFKGLQKTTLLDFPGEIACILFVGGCNFRCPFCQNPDLVLQPETLPTISEEEVLEFLKNRVGLLEGVVISGGEPTLYPDLPEFSQKIKNLGFLVKLDTNGTNPEMVENLINLRLVDYVAMDYKGPLEKYDKYTSVASQDNVLRSKATPYKTIRLLAKLGIDFELRTTVVPTLHTKEDLVEMAKELNKFQVKWYLQQFRPNKCLDKKFEKIKPYPKEFFKEVLGKIKKYLPNTFLRGI
ncbi:anaerobic ribonucleoside-triphosphate reductase activating protein [Candidatus Gottesmanbacteria bacterium]|nr:anaerobic ribonucleoside-triphosphate reductase activating protein [Candidatus Gottesmanbacteria bacterium]MBI5465039.1 anaerobic ribonucleoside-triphosphate reductase activating protein [Candidatus Gottesmanbacteria bacterium]